MFITNRHYNKRGILIMSALCMALVSSSCIRDGARDCTTRVTFDYTYNILSVDAFCNQVDQVTLYVFDENGKLVREHRSDPAANIDNDFRMQIPKLPAGRYRFAAWAQNHRLSNPEASFRIPDLTVGASSLEDLTYYVRRNNDTQQSELNNLLIGMTDPLTIDGASNRNIRVNMKKVTNRVRVIIMPVAGGANIDVADIAVSIVDNVGNGHVNYDYRLLDDAKITYRPYYTANMQPDQSFPVEPGESDRPAVTEISTSRLVAVNAPRLVVASSDGQREIVNVDLIWLLSLTEMENHHEWSLQEYLDRQDEYDITLFVNNGTWVKTTVVINGWVVNNVEIEM